MELCKETEALMNDIWEALTPTEYIQQMYVRTDLNGDLYIPGWYADRPGSMGETPEIPVQFGSYRCRMRWTMQDAEKLAGEFQRLYTQLEAIAPFYTNMHLPGKTMERQLTEPLLPVWKQYLAPLDVGGLDIVHLQDIDARLGMLEQIKLLAGDLAQGKKLDEQDKDRLIEYMDVSVTDEERCLYNRYDCSISADAQKRIGGKLCALEVVFHARRLCRLMNLEAPRYVVENEARSLAGAMAINRFGISRERVDDRLRFRQEMEDFLEEEQLERMEKPMKTNSRKSLAPLFVYLILQNKSSAQTPMRQQQILRELEKEYELRMERKALSRLLHGLSNAQLPICMDKTGVWFAQK